MTKMSSFICQGYPNVISNFKSYQEIHRWYASKSSRNCACEYISSYKHSVVKMFPLKL